MVPKAASAGFDGWADADPIDVADLRKLATLLDKAGGDPKVKASTGAEPDAVPPADPPPDPLSTETPKPPTEAASSILPAAEPEQENTPDPKEDPVSTDLSAFRSRLGLSDDADLDAITTAIDELKTKAATPPVAEPTPEMVAASAAATEKAEKAEQEKSELAKEVSVLASQVQLVTTELAAAKAEKAATVKQTVIQAAFDQGKFSPADREQWEKDYDEAPGAITRVLASIAPGTAVPVSASGVTGPAEPTTDDGLGVSEDSLNAWANSLGFDAKELSRG